MSRDAKDATGADHRTRAFGRKIVLADMHAFESGGDADIGTVVHDQSHAVAQRQAEFAGMAQHLACRADLVAILNESCAAGGELAGVVDDSSRGTQGRGEAGNINDSVEPG